MNDAVVEEVLTSDGVTDRLATACRQAARSLPGSVTPLEAIQVVVDRLSAVSGPGTFWSVFLLEHDRLWSVAQRGYAMIPDGLAADRGIMARAARTGRTQSVPDVAADPDYVAGRRGVVSEIAVPLKTGSNVIGMLNFESEHRLPAGSARSLAQLARPLSELVTELRFSAKLDLPALARLFIHMSSLRNATEIAGLGAQSLARVLDLDSCVILLVDDDGNLQPAASWARDGELGQLLPVGIVDLLQRHVDASAVFDRVAAEDAGIAALAPDCETFVWLPLRANGVQVGVFVGAARVGKGQRRPDAELASLLAAQAAAAIDGAQALTRERRTASTDALTGLLNRRGFDDRLERELERATEERAPLSLCVLDCDEFKAVNDKGGHERGDRVLADVGAILAGLLEPGDAAARLGGDEFAVMLARTDAAGASERAEDMRAELARGLADAGTPLNVSIGVATYPFDGATGTQLVRAADQGLYLAKSSGKDLVVAFRDLGEWSRRGRRPADRRAGEHRGPALDARAGIEALAVEQTPETVLVALCRTLTAALTATASLVSRVDGERIIDGASYALRDIDLGEASSYLIDDFPLTRSVLDRREACAMSFLDDRIDRAEAFVLREKKMNSLLMLPLLLHDSPWGLVEVYDVRLRPFEPGEVELAEALTAAAARRLAELEAEGLDPSVVGAGSLPLQRPIGRSSAPQRRNRAARSG